MAGLRESLDSETKSSAGDKHETGRAMVQLEQEKLSQQLSDIEKSRSVLRRIGIGSNTTKVSLGSLVKTSLADYFIAISSEVFIDNGNHVYCISAGSPMARLLIGKEMGEEFAFNGKKYTILDTM
ncbi:3-oxoacyl-ACP synthase [Flagellimonas meishanensis]|uniref:3-oxoacyl-ACP synthase n=1 Tax=Flagellimonas meishanensis TaxID=2873264 RepID=UPI00223BED9B|nr:3-oxoacyl-ACP synthase [[Muricauda] meishanensis]